MTALIPPYSVKFRYQVTLNAPTTVTIRPGEAPVAYLGYGNIYHLSILDTTRDHLGSYQSRYRTVISASFEPEEHNSEEQFSDIAGITELPTIEFVQDIRCGSRETSPSHIKLEQVSGDCFCVTWSSNQITGGSYCLIPIRFHLPPTKDCHDSGNSGGRAFKLSARTERVLSFNTTLTEDGEYEDCYARLRLFTQSGAKRKLLSDEFLIRKAIENLEASIRQLKTEDNTPRGIQDTISATACPRDQIKRSIRHRSPLGVCWDGDTTGRDQEVERLHTTLATMHKILSSTKPVSVFHPNAATKQDIKTMTTSSKPRQNVEHLVGRSNTPPNLLSFNSSPSSATSSSATAIESEQARPKCSSSILPSDSYSDICLDLPRKKPKHLCSTSNRASLLSEGVPDVKLTGSNTTPRSTVRIEQPLAEYTGSVACFYVRSEAAVNVPHRAVYLTQRTMQALVNGISKKFQIDPTSVGQITYVDSTFTQKLVEEEDLKKLPEGQDLVVEFLPIQYYQCITSTRSSFSPTSYNADIFSVPSSVDSMSEHDLSEDLDFCEFLKLDVVLEEKVDEPNLTGLLDSPWPSETAPAMASYEFDVLEPTWKVSNDTAAISTVLQSCTSPMPTIMNEAALKHQSEPSSTPPSRLAPEANTKRRTPMPRTMMLRESNRIAAAKCRMKRNHEEQRLQSETREKTTENARLQSTIFHLHAEIRRLSALWAAHVDCVD